MEAEQRAKEVEEGELAATPTDLLKKEREKERVITIVINVQVFI
jgi:hypothetical protein